MTSLSSQGTENFSTVSASAPPAANSALNGCRLQTVTIAVRMPNGAQARMVCASVYGDALRWLRGSLAPIVGKPPISPKPPSAAAPPWPARSDAPAARAALRGCHTFRNADSETRLTSAEVMSGSSGPIWLAVKYWVTAKLPPVTSAAGQVSRTPLTPSIMNTSQNGTASDSSGNCRPAIAPI